MNLGYLDLLADLACLQLLENQPILELLKKFNYLVKNTKAPKIIDIDVYLEGQLDLVNQEVRVDLEFPYLESRAYLLIPDDLKEKEKFNKSFF
jgi:7,8-dihydro-6-hydroxymethylpterin-pyrophosphokinase